MNQIKKIKWLKYIPTCPVNTGRSEVSPTSDDDDEMADHDYADEEQSHDFISDRKSTKL